MKTDLLPGIVQIDLSTSDTVSQETGTALVELSLRVDVNDPDVIPKLVEALRDALQPFASKRS